MSTMRISPTELTEFTASSHAALQHLNALPDRDQRCGPQCGFLASPRPASALVDVALAPGRQAPEQEAER
ncbi:hypothetical protein V7793_05355 [Streptomyces sp. KLMMK]|uniref:hypothetical protein n=1 Tax=Streptomyces sp. KLMMK TaxID=3109353 RepID=UPI002FFFC389